MAASIKPFHYFAQSAPQGMADAKFFMMNASGTVAYTVALKTTSVFDLETGAMTLVREQALVTKTELLSARSISYRLDVRLSAQDCRNALDCYLLDANLLVMLCLDRQTSQLQQHVFYLCAIVRKAFLQHTKTRTITSTTMDFGVELGLLYKGRVALVGSSGAFDAERKTVTALLIAANPAKEKLYPDEDMTKTIERFCRFLAEDHPDCAIFPRGVLFDEDGIYFLIKRVEHKILLTDCLGRLLYDSTGVPSCELLKDMQTMCYHGGIRTSHLQVALLQNKSLWMLLDPPDYDKMMTWCWRIYLHVGLPALLYAMINFLRFTVWLRRVDGGWLLRKYMQVLAYFFGPTLTPKLEPDPVLLLYNLDLRTRVLRRAVTDIPVSWDPVETPYFNVAVDTDKQGGLTLVNQPKTPDGQMTVSHYYSPSRPASLAKLAAQRAYRLFPAFERSSEVRRMLGQTEGIGAYQIG